MSLCLLDFCGLCLEGMFAFQASIKRLVGEWTIGRVGPGYLCVWVQFTKSAGVGFY